ncbi:hypothetical protein [Microbacterium sp. A93]|uniref:hypothetical protein n=1 Tax=unclassified Microbacterium TaxID=2609290 RepID=UPI003F426C48
MRRDDDASPGADAGIASSDQDLTDIDRAAIARYLVTLRDSDGTLDMRLIDAFERLTPRQVDVLAASVIDEAAPAKKGPAAIPAPDLGTAHPTVAPEAGRSGWMKRLFGELSKDMPPVVILAGTALAIVALVASIAFLPTAFSGDSSNGMEVRPAVEYVDPYAFDYEGY